VQRSRSAIFARWNMSRATNVRSMGRDVSVKWIKSRSDIRSRSESRRSRENRFHISRRVASSHRLINTARPRVWRPHFRVQGTVTSIFAWHSRYRECEQPGVRSLTGPRLYCTWEVTSRKCER